MRWSKEFMLHFEEHPQSARPRYGIGWAEWLYPTRFMPSVKDSTNFAKRGFGPFDWVESLDRVFELIQQWEYWEDDDGV